MPENNDQNEVEIQVPSEKEFQAEGRENGDVLEKTGLPFEGPEVETVPGHRHDGVDSPKILHRHLRQRREMIRHTVIGTLAATAGNYGVFFETIEPCFIRSVCERHQALGTDGSAVGLNIEKLTGTEAPGAGADLLSADLSLKATINTKQAGVLVASRASRTLKAGDRLSLKDSGTLTAVGTVHVIIEIEYLN